MNNSPAAQTWKPSYVNLCSHSPPDVIRQRHIEHLAYYGATETDCELCNLEPAALWDTFAKSHYRLICHTYLGWKVYMLHTGCFASKPEYEQA